MTRDYRVRIVNRLTGEVEKRIATIELMVPVGRSKDGRAWFVTRKQRLCTLAYAQVAERSACLAIVGWEWLFRVERIVITSAVQDVTAKHTHTMHTLPCGCANASSRPDPSRCAQR